MISNSKPVSSASTEGVVTLEVGDIPNSKEGLRAYLVTFQADENRWSLSFTKAVRKALAYVRENGDAQILLTRSASPKFFSNGLDLKSLNMKDANSMKELGKEVMAAFADVLELPIPTICVLQGHAFGAVSLDRKNGMILYQLICKASNQTFRE
jgi:enoyl-CoA hydratase/carnithine racemase